jgi:hypothetical protein
MMDWSKQIISSLIYRNAAGNFYQPGRMYQLPRKTEVLKFTFNFVKSRPVQALVIS